MSSRDDDLFRAKTAEKANRPRDLVDAMKRVALLHPELTHDEQNLLSIGYKKLITGPRTSWRVVRSILSTETAAGRENRAAIAKRYLDFIEQELENICDEVIGLLQKQLLPHCSSQPYLVFLMKMKADYYRYMAEFKTGSARQEVIDAALIAYKHATDVATEFLPPTDPARLGLALNMSVFFHEIMGDTDRACRVAKSAFDGALLDLDRLSDNHYRDTSLILQLLRDNLTLWCSDIDPGRHDDSHQSSDS